MALFARTAEAINPPIATPLVHLGCRQAKHCRRREFPYTWQSIFDDHSMSSTQTRRRLVVANIASLAAPCLVAAQSSPIIRFICPFPAGGFVDAMMRALAPDLGARLGQPVIVDVRAGANGILASQQLRAAPADGQTWMLATLGTTIALMLQPGVIHPVEGVRAIAMIAYDVPVIVVPAASRMSTLADFLAAARKRPGSLNYLRTGPGSFSHLVAALLHRAAGAELQAVDYRGLPPGVIDLVAGRLDLAILNIGVAMPHIREGQLTPLGVVGPARLSALPGIPTLAEFAIDDADIASWAVAVTPAGTPDVELARVADAFRSVLGTAKARETLHRLGLVPAGDLAPAELDALLRREYVRYGTLIAEMGLRDG